MVARRRGMTAGMEQIANNLSQVEIMNGLNNINCM
jgi:hypothetical protein